MLPDRQRRGQGEKVSIYNQGAAKHPLNGLRLNNSTELHLMQGPITVFDGGVYAGDARIEDLPPGQRAADQLRAGPGSRGRAAVKGRPTRPGRDRAMAGHAHRHVPKVPSRPSGTSSATTTASRGRCSSSTRSATPAILVEPAEARRAHPRLLPLRPEGRAGPGRPGSLVREEQPPRPT